MNNLTWKSLAICELTLILSGCSILQPQPDPSRFFVLMPTIGAANELSTKPSVGLGPIEFPDYLQRAQIVTRISQNEITLSEYHRWGEPLDKSFARVLAVNLSNLLRTDDVVTFPWFNNAKLDVVVRITVQRFEVDGDGKARLLTRWQAVDPAAGTVFRTAESDLSHKAADSTPDAAVSALSATVGKLAEEIAAAIEAALVSRP